LCCAVEGADTVAGDFLGKPVVELNTLGPTGNDALTLGTNPATHNALVERLAPSWKNVIAWNAFLPY
jgi:hypothetical protein